MVINVLCLIGNNISYYDDFEESDLSFNEIDDTKFV